jgi:hypothetical protein
MPMRTSAFRAVALSCHDGALLCRDKVHTERANHGVALGSGVGGRLIVFENPVGCGQEELPLVFECVQLRVEAELGVGFCEIA